MPLIYCPLSSLKVLCSWGISNTAPSLWTCHLPWLRCADSRLGRAYHRRPLDELLRQRWQLKGSHRPHVKLWHDNGVRRIPNNECKRPRIPRQLAMGSHDGSMKQPTAKLA